MSHRNQALEVVVTEKELLQIRVVQAEDLRPLRNDVLRPGLPYETTRFDGDDDSTTIHIAAYDKNNKVVGIGSLLKNAWSGAPDKSAYQLRGMAVAKSLQGTGAGKAVLDAVERKALDMNATLIWCNARKSASGFYAKSGWQIVSDEFDVPTIGPHFVMTKSLAFDDAR